MRIVLAAMALSVASVPMSAQESYADHRPRLLLDTEFGSESYLGYKLPSAGLGLSIEIPVAKRFELQASSTYSPDKKAITNDGQSLKVSGSAVAFTTTRLGFIGTLEYTWLWTSQFNKSGLVPAAGIVLRNDYWGPGRIYLTYLMPTGCVWATASNPLFGGANADLLSMIPFLVLMLLLYIVGREVILSSGPAAVKRR